MKIILLIAVLFAAGMYFAYQPICSFVRENQMHAGMSSKQAKSIGRSIFVIIMIITFLARIAGAIIYKGYDVDINCFLAWADMVFENGIGNFYSLDAFTDYPPGYMYILYGIGAIRSAFGIPQLSVMSIVLTKMPAILADMGIGYLAYKIASKRLRETGAALLAGVWLITPAVFVDSAIWAQVDSVFTLCVVLMCYFITEKKLIPAYFVFALGILIKPQTLIFTPVLFFGIIEQIFIDSYRNDERSVFWRKFWTNLGSGIAAILMIGLLMIPFGFSDALKQYTETLGSYPYASVNAYNFWTMIGKNWVSQEETLFGIAYRYWGMAAIIAAVLFTALIHFKNKDFRSKYYFSAGLLLTIVFTLSVRMHERYIYPAIILALLCFAARPAKKQFLNFILLATVSFLNIVHMLFFYDPNNFDRLATFPMCVGAMMVCVLVYNIYLAVTAYTGAASEEDGTKQILRELSKPVSHAASKLSVIRPSAALGKIVKLDFLAMAVITIVYAVIAFTNLGDMEAPETGYSFVEEGQVVLDFGESVEIEKIWNFLGYKNNPKYTIKYSEVADGGFVELFSEEVPYDAGSVFNWNEQELNIKCRYLVIEASEMTYEDSVLEFVFTDAEGSTILPANASDYPALFDEQDIFSGRDSYMNGTYFDEIYHARTAYEMIEGLYCYENTHPPLGKGFIALGILMFGMNPFGWRFMGTVFGVLMLPALYVFAKKLFKETWLATAVTTLFAFDFMHFAQTRIATIDVFVTLFIILAYLFMYCYSQKSFYDTALKDTFIPLGLCGIAMGFSWACKWTGIYASVGLCLIFFLTMGQRFREYIYASKNPNGVTEGISHKEILESFYPKFFKTIAFCCIFFIVIPLTIYVASYIPTSDGTDHGLIQRVIDNQESMLSYHSGLEAEHSFSSEWYEWPMMKRPIWFYSGTVGENLKEGISSFGNPLVWWVGIPAFIMVLYYGFIEKERKGRFLTYAYLSQYLPWMFIGRTIFIYHYFPSVPFVTLMIGYCLKKIVDYKPKLKPAIFVYVGLAIGLFIMFYPVLSGMAVDPDYVNKYLRWFDSWVLI